MSSTRPNSPGNSCAETLTISAIIEPLLKRPPARPSPPSGWPYDGGCDFPIDPDLQGNSTPIVWLPRLDPTAVLIIAAPETFADAKPIGAATRVFTRRAADGEYCLIDDGHGRLPAVVIDSADALTPAAVVIPLDAHFAVRADAALRMWRVTTGRGHRQPHDRITLQRRRRLSLTLRALDGRLAAIRIVSSRKPCLAKPVFQLGQPGRHMICAIEPYVCAAAV
jgi:Uncharacterized conserved protein (DUF2285)